MSAAKTKPIIESRLIIGATPPEEFARAVRAAQGIPADTQINPCVFEVTVAGQTRYCCWSGGRLVQGEDGEPQPEFTVPGRAALEALLALPFIDARAKVIVQEVKLGPTPVQEKVIASFLASSGSRAPICFVGDLAKELDGQMATSMNMQGFVPLAECIERHSAKGAV